MNKTPVYIDTDASTDDALALIIAMTHPSIRIVGISCVGGNVPIDKVVQNVLYLSECLYPQASVHKGAKGPLKRTLEAADFIHGKDGLGDIGLDLKGRLPQKEDAVTHLIRMVEKHEHKINIVTLGPMTNLALALERQPDIASKIAHCYIMGGLYQMPGNITPVAEFNFWADPEAAKICIHSLMPKTLIGWDATISGGYLDLEELLELKNRPLPISDQAVEMQNIKLKWLKDNGQRVICYLADPLAMIVMLNSEVATESGEYYCDIVLAEDDHDTRGMLIVDTNGIKNKAANARVVHSVNKELFKKMLFAAFN